MSRQSDECTARDALANLDAQLSIASSYARGNHWPEAAETLESALHNVGRAVRLARALATVPSPPAVSGDPE